MYREKSLHLMDTNNDTGSNSVQQQLNYSEAVGIVPPVLPSPPPVVVLPDPQYTTTLFEPGALRTLSYDAALCQHF